MIIKLRTSGLRKRNRQAHQQEIAPRQVTAATDEDLAVWLDLKYCGDYASETSKVSETSKESIKSKIGKIRDHDFQKYEIRHVDVHPRQAQAVMAMIGNGTTKCKSTCARPRI